MAITKQLLSEESKQTSLPGVVELGFTHHKSDKAKKIEDKKNFLPKRLGCNDLAHFITALIEDKTISNEVRNYEILRAFKGFFTELAKLHKHKLLHLDLQEGNIFVNEKGEIQLTHLKNCKKLGWDLKSNTEIVQGDSKDVEDDWVGKNQYLATFRSYNADFKSANEHVLSWYNETLPTLLENVDDYHLPKMPPIKLISTKNREADPLSDVIKQISKRMRILSKNIALSLSPSDTKCSRATFFQPPESQKQADPQVLPEDKKAIEGTP
ncbi:MAG: hypothetical protein HKM04_11020 [Legionellales bacterium]|nr:hypothetical protein [Legionellales bacterium]